MLGVYLVTVGLELEKQKHGLVVIQRMMMKMLLGGILYIPGKRGTSHRR